jgi:N-methylhydantoinase B
MVSKSKKTDPSTLTFFANFFFSVAEEMGVTLMRTAYSANIKERRDYSCALFDGSGRIVAQAAHMPVHLGAMPMSVEAAIEHFGPLRPGDVIMLNDPFAGGTHLPDITLVSPLWAEKPKGSQPLFHLATRAHHADVGGITPGSMPLSREIFQEGLRIPPVKLRDRWQINEAVLEILKANVRTPHEREGDLKGQIAAHDVGEARLKEALDRYGAAALGLRVEELLQYGERLMRALIRRIPNGRYTFEDVLDGDGITKGEIPIQVTLTISGKGASVDFTGSAPQCAGSVNAIKAITCAATWYCFLCLLVTPSRLHKEAVTDPPLNAGCFAPIKVIAPEGSIVNAKPPCAVAGGNVETSQRIVDVVMGALAQALPDIIPAASQGTMNNLTLGGWDERRGAAFAYYETISGGMGARPDGPGIDGVHTHMTNTMNTPVEALESAFPFRVERYEIASGSGGKGRHRGGCGIRRDLCVLADARGAILSERRKHGPFGLEGGTPGKTGKNTLIRGGRRIVLPGKVELDLRTGYIISIRTPGGGGWGKTS